MSFSKSHPYLSYREGQFVHTTYLWHSRTQFSTDEIHSSLGCFFVYTYGYGDSFQRQVEFSRLKTNLNQQNLARRQAIFLLILFSLILHFIPCKGSDWWFSKPTREIYKMRSSLSAVGTKPVELYYRTCRIKVSEQGAEENMWIQDEGVMAMEQLHKDEFHDL